MPPQGAVHSGIEALRGGLGCTCVWWGVGYAARALEETMHGKQA